MRDVETRGKPVTESKSRVLTIGHSTMSIDAFLAILRQTGVTVVADVRTSPFSRRLPHFSRDELRAALKDNDVKYVFLGKALGGRPLDKRLYCDGVADYERMASEPTFLEGLDRVMKGATEHVIALMCSERDPLDCHRCLLVGRALAERLVHVDHILHDGRLIDHDGIEQKLLEMSGAEMDDLFASRDDRLATAYKKMAKKVAFETAKLDAAFNEAAE